LIRGRCGEDIAETKEAFDVRHIINTHGHLAMSCKFRCWRHRRPPLSTRRTPTSFPRRRARTVAGTPRPTGFGKTSMVIGFEVAMRYSTPGCAGGAISYLDTGESHHRRHICRRWVTGSSHDALMLDTAAHGSGFPFPRSWPLTMDTTV
jgi:hypothetical protein